MTTRQIIPTWLCCACGKPIAGPGVCPSCSLTVIPLTVPIRVRVPIPTIRGQTVAAATVEDRKYRQPDASTDSFPRN